MSDFCPYAKRSNACQLSNLSYDEQLRLKEKQCRRFIAPFCTVDPITPSAPTGYRNKAQFVYKRADKRTMLCGVYKSTARTVAPVESCALCSERANTVARELGRLFLSFKIPPYDFHTRRGWLKSVLIREARGTGELMAVIIGADRIFPAKKTFTTALLKACPDITTVVQTVSADPNKLTVGETVAKLFGEGYITDTLLGRRFVISPASFYQINHAMTGLLYKKAIEFAGLSGNETVLDAYCGVGTIGLCIAPYAGRVLGVEQNRAAVRDAVRNARLNHADNITFIAADAKDYARALREQGEHIDVAFVDPPRAGCTASFLNSLARLGPARIVYISCNAETQARDLRLLSAMGYRVDRCAPFDLFPGTKHVETVVQITYVKKEEAK